ncbi:MAG TPA: ABC transporter substrate-binding protein [Casimicrobiaceae bacterium]|jgi:ABC-type transport system substrate-binding protein|nr:ABC transporter substrate-binding protein [Casimicrobiaceae bacterium]
MAHNRAHCCQRLGDAMCARRIRLWFKAVVSLVLFVSFSAGAADPIKVLRVALNDIETLDPQQYNDSPSFDVISAIFEGLYEWDYLATSPTLSPVTAAGPPQISADALTWTVKIKPGIFFTDDPAFKGKPRELTAQDAVYSITRFLDPNLRRGGAPESTNVIVGMRAVVDAAAKSGKLDYDRPIEGLRALDRYTLQLKFTHVNYPIAQLILNFLLVAREVVEAAHGDIRDRPVGTGAFRLREWKRGSRIVLESNPKYRKLSFPSSRDPELAPLVKSMQGKTLPQIGVVEINIIEEYLPRLLEFERGTLDIVVLREEIAARMLTDNKLRPEYAARGIVRHVYPEPYFFGVTFNMDDPVVGGMTNDRVALRRAIALGFDRKSLIDVAYAGQALPANQLVPPGVAGYDPTLPLLPYDPVAANALLNRFGYARGADGFRTTPDGKPLTITMSLRTGAISRETATLWKRNLDVIGLRSEYNMTPFQDLIKQLEAGKFQIYSAGYGGTPFGDGEMNQLNSREPPTANTARFKLAEYDLTLDRFYASPNEGGRIAASRAASEIARTYEPLIPTIFRLQNDFVQPWVLGYNKPLYTTYWKYLDIDLARQRAAAR